MTTLSDYITRISYEKGSSTVAAMSCNGTCGGGTCASCCYVRQHDDSAKK